MNENPEKLSTKTKVIYGIGAFGYGSVGQTLGSFLMFFGTGILGIPGALMGLAVAVSTVWDATTDPFIGHFSDNSKSHRFGKRHAFILVGCIFVAIFNLFIWGIAPGSPTGIKFGLMFTFLMLVETFNTTYSTPYQALGLDLAKTYEDRTAVQAYKTVFSFLALLVPSLLMAVFLREGRYETLADSVSGYRYIAIVTSSLCVICGLVVFLGTYKNRSISKFARGSGNDTDMQKPKTMAAIMANFFSVITQKNVGRLIIGYAISLTAGAFLTSLGLHIFTYTFSFTASQIPFIMVCLVLGIIGGQPLWFWLSRKFDKSAALVMALFAIIAGMVIFSTVLTFRNAIPEGLVLPLVSLTIFICGIGTGCLYSLPVSMFADCIELEKQKTGEDKTAISAGFLTFCTKISNAVIMFIIGVSLDLIGFNGGESTQTMAVQNWLGWLLIIGVIVACVAAIVVYSGYSYKREDFTTGVEE